MTRRDKDKLVAELGSLLGLGRPGGQADGRQDGQRGCWPSHADDAAHQRGCWPNPSDLRKGDDTPADALRKAMRGPRPGSQRQ